MSPVSVLSAVDQDNIEADIEWYERRNAVVPVRLPPTVGRGNDAYLSFNLAPRRSEYLRRSRRSTSRSRNHGCRPTSIITGIHPQRRDPRKTVMTGHTTARRCHCCRTISATIVHQGAATSLFLTLDSNPHVLPPMFGFHTTIPIPSNDLITPYKSSISPSVLYLSDPLNAYAHLSAFVHHIVPPLDVTLDSRLVGNHSRFGRCGCRLNAILRPVLFEKGRNKPDLNPAAPQLYDSPAERQQNETTLGFRVFALSSLNANEEIIWIGNGMAAMPYTAYRHFWKYLTHF